MLAQFNPFTALLGGTLIGIASVLLMALTGRIAGISGILGGCFAFVSGDKVWRLAFIAGMIVAPIASGLVGYPLPAPQMPARNASPCFRAYPDPFGAKQSSSRCNRLLRSDARPS